MGNHRHTPQVPDLGRVAEAFRRGSRRLTGPRQAVFEVLCRAQHPLSIKDIHSALPKGDSDLVTVYRSVALLEELHLVKRFDLGDGAARYELLREGDDGHHHHLVCTCCADVVEIEECAIMELEARIAARNGFKAVTHRLEFFGICPTCQTE